jgi:hypothetical protein
MLQALQVNVKKTFMFITEEWAKLASVFVPGKLFQPNPLFVSYAVA